MPSRIVVVSRASPAERDPGVGRARAGRRRAHLQVVVGAEEGVEAERLGAPGHGQEVVVGRALLGLGEDAELLAGTR